MGKFEIVGIEFVDHVRNYDLSTKEKFVDFFMVYYEYSFLEDEFAQLFETVESAQEKLLKVLQQSCEALEIDYEKQYKDLSNDEIKRLWWSLQLFITEAIFKEEKPIVVYKTVQNLRNGVYHLPVKTLEIQMMFINVLLENLPFSPRPLFTIGYNNCNFEKVREDFMKFYHEHEKVFSVRKLKDNLPLPYDFSSRFLTKADLFCDTFIVCICNAIPLDGDEAEEMLRAFVYDYLQCNCVLNRITKEVENKIWNFTLEFAKTATVAMSDGENPEQ